MLKTVRQIHRFMFARRSLRTLNTVFLHLGVRGLGLLNYDDDTSTGEEHFLNRFMSVFKQPVILDIGANVGHYSAKIKGMCKAATVYAFEPHPRTFETLKQCADRAGFTAINAACGDVEATMRLYDYAGGANGSEHASLHKEVIEKIHHADSTSWDVTVSTVDLFVKQRNLPKINLLKIDTEGNELKVLQGAQETIKSGGIDVIHFEFNSMNIVSRSFMRDFMELLPGWSFYRMLPHTLLPMGAYKPLTCELFAFQNIVVVRPELARQFE